MLLLLTGSIPIFANDKVLGIIVELASGERLEYRVADNPTFVFDGAMITLTAADASVEYAPADLLKVAPGEVKNVSNRVEEQPSSSSNMKVKAGFVRLSGFAAGTVVKIYAVSGSLLKIFHVGSDGTLVILISSLPQGISIIQANNQFIKITRK